MAGLRFGDPGLGLVTCQATSRSLALGSANGFGTSGECRRPSVAPPSSRAEPESSSHELITRDTASTSIRVMVRTSGVALASGLSATGVRNSDSAPLRDHRPLPQSLTSSPLGSGVVCASKSVNQIIWQNGLRLRKGRTSQPARIVQTPFVFSQSEPVTGCALIPADGAKRPWMTIDDRHP